MKSRLAFAAPLVIFVAVAVVGHADEGADGGEPARLSSASLVGNRGTGDYGSGSLSVNLGIDPSLQLRASASTARSSGVTSSGELRAGADVRMSEEFSWNAFLVGRREPSSTRSRGLSLGADWALSSLWGASSETRLAMQLDGLRYVGGGTQRSITIALDHELGASFSARLTGARHLYGARETSLSTLFARRRVLAGDALVNGLVDRSLSLGLSWEAIPEFQLHLDATSARSLVAGVEEESGTLELGADIPIQSDLFAVVGVASTWMSGTVVRSLTVGARMEW